MKEGPTPADIRKLRSEHALTQEQLARMLYVSRATANNWETGRSRMSKANFELLHLKLSRRQDKRLAELERTIDNLRAEVETLTGD